MLLGLPLQLLLLTCDALATLRQQRWSMGHRHQHMITCIKFLLRPACCIMAITPVYSIMQALFFHSMNPVPGWRLAKPVCPALCTQVRQMISTLQGNQIKSKERKD